MKQSFKGKCELNKKGILRLYYLNYDYIPAIKRHAENILNNRDSKIQYGNALNINVTTGIPLTEIIMSS